MKKIVQIGLFLGILLTIFLLGTINASAATSGYYTYTVSNSKAKITDVDTSISGAVVIPEKLGGYPVTSIDLGAFSYCSRLTSITIPNSVTSISDTAFDFCSGLTSITIPNSITSIEHRAFSYCSGLTSITIPDSVTSIDDDAFLGCRGLISITVDKDNEKYQSSGNCIIETASKRLVVGCKNSVIPSDGSVTSIGGAFQACYDLTSITIPNSVTSIGDGAFRYCSGLTSVTIPNSVTSIGDEAFSYCSGLTSITIPNSVTSIGDEAFRYCSGLTSVTISNRTTSIADSAFDSSCTIIRNSKAPGSPFVLSTSENSVTLKGIENGEYSIDGINWQSSTKFTGLEKAKKYTFYQRYAETETTYASSKSLGRDVIFASAGDLDEDSEITDWDGVMLARHLAGWNVGASDSVLDIDGDGEITDWDGVMFDRYLAGWDVEVYVGTGNVIIGYYITYKDSQNASNSNSTTYKTGQKIYLSPLSKTHYIFEGWYDENGIKITALSNLSDDIILTARWNAIQYTITYQGLKSSSNPNPTTYNADSMVTLKNLADSNGYYFDGWYDKNNNKVTNVTVAMGNVTLTAKWKANPYTITYKGLKSSSNPNPTTYNDYSPVTLKSLADSDGYYFVGWYDENNNKVTEVTGDMGNVTLTAKWNEILPLNVTFSGTLSGTPTVSSKYVSDGKYDVTISFTLVNVGGADFVGFEIYVNGEYATGDGISSSLGKVHNITRTIKGIPGGNCQIYIEHS